MAERTLRVGESGESVASIDARSGLGSLNMLGTLALSWIDHDALPRVIVSGDLLILWANAAARAAFARRRDLESRLGALATVAPNHAEALQNFLAGVGAGVESLSLKRTDGDGHLVLRAQRIDWSADGIFGITFHGTGADYQARYANLDVAFGLTRAELGVLSDLLDGRSAEAIAEGRSTSVETTRSHIRKIYAKVAVNSREALFHRVQSFRL